MCCLRFGGRGQALTVPLLPKRRQSLMRLRRTLGDENGIMLIGYQPVLCWSKASWRPSAVRRTGMGKGDLCAASTSSRLCVRGSGRFRFVSRRSAQRAEAKLRAKSLTGITVNWPLGRYRAIHGYGPVVHLDYFGVILPPRERTYAFDRKCGDAPKRQDATPESGLNSSSREFCGRDPRPGLNLS